MAAVRTIGLVGGGGYIGSLIQEAFSSLPEYAIVVFMDKQIDHASQRKEIQACDVIVYLAGMSREQEQWRFKNKDPSQEKDEQVKRANVNDILKWGKHMTSNQLLIYASTVAIYQHGLVGPNEIFDEEVSINQVSLNMDRYAESMALREQEVRNLGVSTIGLRLGCVVGACVAQQRKDTAYFGFLRDGLLHGQVTVFNPLIKRYILTKEDLTNAIHCIIQHHQPQNRKITHEIFNLGSFNTTLGHMAKDVSECINVKLEQIAKTDISKENNDLGYAITSKKFCDRYHFQFTGSPSYVVKSMLDNFVDICNVTPALPSDLSCRICSSTGHLSIVLDLGAQRLANDFQDKDKQKATETKQYKLCLIRCKICSHLQLDTSVDPSRLFSNYIYASGTSETAMTHFKWFADFIRSENGPTSTEKVVVLDIACNDGSQLDCLKSKNCITLGIDPAANFYLGNQEKGHHVLTAFWGTQGDKDAIQKFLAQFPKLDVIICQNVLAHVPFPVAFLKACRDAMTVETKLYVQTSQSDMILHGEFDTVYHEHAHFFTMRSMRYAAELADLEIVNVAKIPVHGTSYLFTLQRCKSEKQPLKNELVQKLEEEENGLGLYQDGFYVVYRNQVLNICAWLSRTIEKLQQQDGCEVSGYGAAAKGMTLLSMLSDSAQQLECIIDESPLKQNKFTPGKYPIPVCDLLTYETQASNKHKKQVLIVLAWNCWNEIVNKLKNIKYVGLLIRPFPKQSIYLLDGNGDVELQETCDNTPPLAKWIMKDNKGKTQLPVVPNLAND